LTGISTQCSGLTETQPMNEDDYNLNKELDEIADQLRIIELEIKILNKRLDDEQTRNTQND